MMYACFWTCMQNPQCFFYGHSFNFVFGTFCICCICCGSSVERRVSIPNSAPCCLCFKAYLSVGGSWFSEMLWQCLVMFGLGFRASKHTPNIPKCFLWLLNVRMLSIQNASTFWSFRPNPGGDLHVSWQILADASPCSSYTVVTTVVTTTVVTTTVVSIAEFNCGFWCFLHGDRRDMLQLFQPLHCVVPADAMLIQANDQCNTRRQDWNCSKMCVAFILFLPSSEEVDYELFTIILIYKQYTFVFTLWIWCCSYYIYMQL